MGSHAWILNETYFVVYLPSSLIVIDEKFEPVDLLEAAFVSH